MSKKSGITGTSSNIFAIDTDGYNIKLSAENNALVIKDGNNDPSVLTATSGGTS